MENRELWLSVLNRLSPTIRRGDFITWFQYTDILEKKSDKVTIGVPTAFASKRITDIYALKVLQAVQELDENIKTVDYEVKDSLSYEGPGRGVDVMDLVNKEDGKKVRKVRKMREVMVSKGHNGEKIFSQMMNERYTLKNFIVGQENALPHAASKAVANMPGGIYNPLYVYGKVGLGKTHLLQAIGNEVLKNSPEKVVKYITAEKFVTEVVEAIGRRHMNKFKDQYRNVDVFLIDDVQFFARKDSSQQEFFHTFNELYERNKQIVITSDRAPSELDGLDERITSRFKMGMVVELLFPGFETRLAILQEKCQEYGVILDPEVLNFVASNVHNSVRELEGVLRQAVAETQLNNRVPTIKTVAEIIKRMNKAQEIIGYDVEEKKTQAVVRNIEEVIHLVANYYKISVDDLMGNDRHREYAVPRQVCMYLIKNELGQSYEKIGLSFGGRNHTTVMHACNKTAERLKKDIRLVRDINTLKREMGL